MAREKVDRVKDISRIGVERVGSPGASNVFTAGVNTPNINARFNRLSSMSASLARVLDEREKKGEIQEEEIAQSEAKKLRSLTAYADLNDSFFLPDATPVQRRARQEQAVEIATLELQDKVRLKTLELNSAIQNGEITLDSYNEKAHELVTEAYREVLEEKQGLVDRSIYQKGLFAAKFDEELQKSTGVLYKAVSTTVYNKALDDESTIIAAQLAEIDQGLLEAADAKEEDRLRSSFLKIMAENHKRTEAKYGRTTGAGIMKTALERFASKLALRKNAFGDQAISNDEIADLLTDFGDMTLRGTADGPGRPANVQVWDTPLGDDLMGLINSYENKREGRGGGAVSVQRKVDYFLGKHEATLDGLYKTAATTSDDSGFSELNQTVEGELRASGLDDVEVGQVMRAFKRNNKHAVLEYGQYYGAQDNNILANAEGLTPKQFSIQLTELTPNMSSQRRERLMRQHSDNLLTHLNPTVKRFLSPLEDITKNSLAAKLGDNLVTYNRENFDLLNEITEWMKENPGEKPEDNPALVKKVEELKEKRLLKDEEIVKTKNNLEILADSFGSKDEVAEQARQARIDNLISSSDEIRLAELAKFNDNPDRFKSEQQLTILKSFMDAAGAQFAKHGVELSIEGDVEGAARAKITGRQQESKLLAKASALYTQAEAEAKKLFPKNAGKAQEKFNEIYGASLKNLAEKAKIPWVAGQTLTNLTGENVFEEYDKREVFAATDRQRRIRVATTIANATKNFPIRTDGVAFGNSDTHWKDLFVKTSPEGFSADLNAARNLEEKLPDVFHGNGGIHLNPYNAMATVINPETSPEAKRDAKQALQAQYIRLMETGAKPESLAAIAQVIGISSDVIKNPKAPVSITGKPLLKEGEYEALLATNKARWEKKWDALGYRLQYYKTSDGKTNIRAIKEINDYESPGPRDRYMSTEEEVKLLKKMKSVQRELYLRQEQFARPMEDLLQYLDMDLTPIYPGANGLIADKEVYKFLGLEDEEAKTSYIESQRSLLLSRGFSPNESSN